MLKDFKIGEWVELEQKTTKEKLIGFVTYKGVNYTQIKININGEWEKVDYSHQVEQYIRFTRCKNTYFDNWKEMLIDASLIMRDKDLFMELVSTK